MAVKIRSAGDGFKEKVSVSAVGDEMFATQTSGRSSIVPISPGVRCIYSL